MHLAPQEIDKLLLHQAGFLAQKRLARGLRLNYPEAVALLATQMLEFIRDGRSVADLMDLGRQVLGRAEVLDGVAELVREVQVEGTFPDGTKLVTVHHPIVSEQGNLELALYGSFLPVPGSPTGHPGWGGLPAHEAFRAVDVAPIDHVPGAVLAAPSDLVANDQRETASLVVTNTGDRPIQVGSHYHFIETNRALLFDRSAAYGKRLDIPAGTAVRFEPGESKTVNLVAIAGRQIIRGGNALADGPVTPDNRERALARVRDQGFGDTRSVS